MMPRHSERRDLGSGEERLLRRLVTRNPTTTNRAPGGKRLDPTPTAFMEESVAWAGCRNGRWNTPLQVGWRQVPLAGADRASDAESERADGPGSGGTVEQSFDDPEDSESREHGQDDVHERERRVARRIYGEGIPQPWEECAGGRRDAYVP